MHNEKKGDNGVRNWHDGVFFGLHFDIHANAADQHLGRDVTVDHLLEQFQKIRPDFVQCDCKGHPGYASYPTKVGVPAPGIEKDALRVWREATKRLGIPLVMHFSGVWDRVAVERHPEWARVPSARERASGEVRREETTCPLSPYTDYMIAQMLELVREYDVDGFWVDGENWATRPCYCERCTQRFCAETGAQAAPMGEDEPHWDEWLAFTRKLFVEHVKTYADTVHAAKPTCTICSNWMYTIRQPDAIAAPVDYLSGDFAWIWSLDSALLESRFMANRGLKWDLMAWGFTSDGPMDRWEFKSAQALCQEAAVVMSMGGAFMVYDTPNRTGNLIAWHMDELAEVARFCRARQAYSQDTVSHPQALVLHAPEHYYKAMGADFFSGGHGKNAVAGAVHALMDNHISVDIMNPTDAVAHLGEYPLVVVPEQEGLPENVVARLRTYAENGGRLLVSGAATKAFEEILGVKAQKDLPDSVFYVRKGQETTAVAGPRIQVEPVSAHVLLACQNSRDTDAFAENTNIAFATVNDCGKGRVMGLYADAFTYYHKGHYPRLRAVLGQCFAAMEAQGLLSVEAPAYLYITPREKDGKLLIHLFNLASENPLSPERPIVESVPQVGPVRVACPLAKEPRSVSLAPSLAPVDWTYAKGMLRVRVERVHIHEILEVE